MRAGAAAAMLAVFLGVTSAWAVEPDEIMEDPDLEARARAISAGLRCLVCQNQSIDDSAAPLARDLRLIVRERLKTGDSDDQVRAFLVSRYGNFVLLRPPFEAATALLWGTPVLVLALAAVALRSARGGRRRDEVPPLSEGERERIAALTRDTRT